MLWLRRVLCKLPLWFHRCRVIEEYDAQTRKLRCVFCGRYFAMSDRHQAVLPWDADFEQIIRDMYGLPRSKL